MASDSLINFFSLGFRQTTFWLMLTVGIVFLISGHLFPPIIEQFVQEGLEREALDLSFNACRTNQTSCKRWTDAIGSAEKLGVPPLWRTFVLYDVINAKDVLCGERVHLRPVGPFRFRTYKQRDVIEYEKNGKIMTYNETKYHVLVDAEDDKLNQKIVTANLVFQGIATLGPELIQNIYSDVEEIDRLYVKITARQLLFGYQDSKTQQYFPGLLSNGSQYTAQIQTATRELVSFNGMKYMRTKKSVIGRTMVPLWGNEEANRVQGTVGETFPLPIGDEVTAWVDDLQRAVTLSRQNETKLYGIPVVHFQGDPQTFTNSSANAEAYYISKYSGFLNMSHALQGLNIFISAPNMAIGVDENLRKLIDIDEPELPFAEVESFLEVDPLFGMVLRGKKRSQVNLLIQPIEITANETWFANLAAPHIMHPLLRVEEAGEIDEHQAKKYARDVIGNLRIAHNVDGPIFAIGIVLSIVGLIGSIWMNMQLKRFIVASLDDIDFDLQQPLLN